MKEVTPDELDGEARAAWTSGNLVRAARLVQLGLSSDPDRKQRWTERQAALLERAGKADLRTQSAVRLIAAGIRHDDPGLTRLTAHNEAVGASNRQPDRDPGLEAAR